MPLLYSLILSVNPLDITTPKKFWELRDTLLHTSQKEEQFKKVG